MLDSRELHGVLDRLNTTGCIITTAFEGRRDGCFISFVTQCSIHPPRLLALTSHENLTHELIERSQALALHPVGRGQADWLELFGEQSGREIDKFARVAWSPGETGCPLLADALGYIEGRVLRSMDCGDHTARLVEPVAAALRDPDAVPMTVFELFARDLIRPSARLGNPWTEAVGSRQ